MAAGRSLTWICYNDGPLNVTATTAITGYTVDASHYITLTVAGASQVATGNSQRHTGVAGTGTVIEAGSIGGDAPVFDIAEAFTRFEWLEIDGNSFVSQDGVVVTATNALLTNLIVHDIGANDAANCANATNGCSAIVIENTATSTEVRNSIVYDYGQDGITSGATGVTIANTTIFRTKQSGEGLQLGAGRLPPRTSSQWGTSPTSAPRTSAPEPSPPTTTSPPMTAPTTTGARAT